MVVPILSTPKEPPNTSVCQEPCAVGTRIKLEMFIIIPVRLYFASLFWFALYLFYMIPESTQGDIAQRTRERRERARKSPVA